MAEVLTDKEINELLETITVGPSRKSTIKPGTPIKGWKNVETNEVKSYDEWIKTMPINKDDFTPTPKDKVDFFILTDRLIPIA